VSEPIEHLSQEHALTRRNLLDAAAEVFAEVGFRAATVREICQRAGANVAAVNYHFGDKEKLYLEVLRRSQEEALQKYPPDYGIPPDASAEDKLGAFIRSLLLRIFDQGTTAYHGKIMAREMVDPTPALDTLVQERIRALALHLGAIIRELLGPGANEQTVRLCLLSVVSQCMFQHHCRSVVNRVFPDQTYTPDDIERLARHITRFSLGALREMRGHPKQ
jgi:AcrR family transcriptional regulator